MQVGRCRRLLWPVLTRGAMQLTPRNVAEVLAPSLFKADEDAELEELERKASTQQSANDPAGAMHFDEEAIERRVEQQFAFEESKQR